jgi:hypothetical protein
MKQSVQTFLLGFLLLLPGLVAGQLNIAAGSTNYTINFDATVADVNTGQLVLNTPPAATPATGQLDSDAWEVLPLLSGASSAFKGQNNGGVSTGGWYSFLVNTGNRAMGAQPTSGFGAHSAALTISNETGYLITSLTVSFKLYAGDPQTRNGTINYSGSSGAGNSGTETTDNILATGTAGSGTWKYLTKTLNITGLSLDPCSTYLLTWSSANGSGSGSSDEWAVDDIVVNATTTGSLVVADQLEFTVVPSAVYEIPGTFDITVCATNGTSIDCNYATPIVLDQESGPPVQIIDPVSGATPVNGCATFTITPGEYDNPYTMTFNATSGAFPVAISSEVTVSSASFSCPSPGDIIITEFMADPSDVADTDGEYFEIYNRSANAIDIAGWEVIDLGSQIFALPSAAPIILNPGDYFVLGNNAAIPGVDYVYPASFTLSNSVDEIILRCPHTGGLPLKIFEVLYVNGSQFGGGTANELLCLQFLGNSATEADYIAATDALNYDGDAATDEGSPDGPGNTETNPIIPTKLVFTSTPSVAAFGVPFTLEVCATDANDLIPCDFIDNISLTQTAGTAVTSIVPNPSAASKGCAAFTVTPATNYACENIAFSATSGTLTAAASGDIPVQAPLSVEDFSACPPSWMQFSVTGDSTWLCNSNGYMDMNGFTLDNEDWLISPAIDLDVYQGETASFNTRERYAHSPLLFQYSTDYTGSGDPNLATWTVLPFVADSTTYNGSVWNPWTNSGVIDISAIAGTSVYFAFKYTCTTTSSSQWLVDNIQILGCPIVCNITDIAVANISGCDPATNNFTADVTVTFENAPATGNLVLSGGGTASVPVASLGSTTAHTFTGVAFSGNGTLKGLTATFDMSATTCAYSVTDIPGTDIACGTQAGLVINEVYNNGTFDGANCGYHQTFIELLVTANLQDTLTRLANLEGWMIEPSTSNNGHIRFKAGCFTDVPVGALMVIYDEDNVPSGISGPDEADSNNDLVYFIPSGSGCLEYTTNTTFPGTTYTSGAGVANCTDSGQLGEMYPGDNLQTRNPHTGASIFHQTLYNVADQFGESTAYDCGNVHQAASFLQNGSPTPGASNTANNQIVIANIRLEAGNVDGFSHPDEVHYLDLLTNDGRMPACGNLTVCTDSLFVTGNIAINTVRQAASKIYSDAVVTMDTTYFHAGDLIVLKPGFHAQAGTTFTASLQACPANLAEDETPLAQATNGTTLPVNTARNTLEQASELRMRLVPTLAHSTVRLEMNQPMSANARVEVLDMSGRVLEHDLLGQGGQVLSLDVSQLGSGIYFVRVLTAGQPLVEKFVKL